MLSLAGAGGVVQRDHDRERGVHGAHHRGRPPEGRASADPLSALTEQQHAGNRRVVEVVAGAVAKRSILAITGEAAEHELGVALVQRRNTDAEAVHDSRSKALDDDVGGCRKTKKRLAPQRDS